MAAVAAGALLVSTAAAAVGATPAVAADTVTCSPNISLFATDTSGQLWFWRGLANFGAASSGGTTIAKGGPVKGTTPDLVNYPTMFGSALPGNPIAAFGVSNAGARQGLSYWQSSGAVKLTGALYGFVNPAPYKNQITADRLGNIYTIEWGLLEEWKYDPATGTWPLFGRVLASGWDAYDMIVATDDGVIWARKPTGELYRYRVEPGSQRGLVGKQIGTGFQKYKSVFSAGGDTLVGVLKTAGSLEAWRYVEDDGTGHDKWAVAHVALDVPTTTNFSGYQNIWADPTTCRNSVSHSVPQPTVVAPVNAPVTVAEHQYATDKGTDFAYVDNSGFIGVAQKPSNDSTALPAPQSISGSRAYAGPASIWQSTWSSATDLKQTVLALDKGNGHVQRFTQDSAAGSNYGAPAEHGGIAPYAPTSVRLGASWAAAFLTGADGKLFVSDSAWSKNTDGSTFVRPNLTSWRDVTLPSGVTLAGSVTATALDTTHAALVARDTTGKLWSAVYTAVPLGTSTVGTWQSLGGTGFTGTPAAVMLPGPVIQVVARNATGDLVTQLQAANGTFPGTWVPLGAPSATTTGSPSAVLDPATNRLVVFARDTDGSIWGAQQRLQACNTYDWWKIHDANLLTPLVADPTGYVVTRSGGKEWGVVSYTNLFELTVYYKSAVPPPTQTGGCTAGSGTAGAASRAGTASGDTGASARAAVTHPSFTKRTFPVMQKP